MEKYGIRKSPLAICCVLRSNLAPSWVTSKRHYGCWQTGYRRTGDRAVKERIAQEDCRNGFLLDGFRVPFRRQTR